MCVWPLCVTCWDLSAPLESQVCGKNTEEVSADLPRGWLYKCLDWDLSWAFGTQRGISPAGGHVCSCVCLSVCLTEEHFQESYCLRHWEGGVFLLAAFGQVCLRVLGLGVVAQKVERYSAFEMYLVNTSSRKSSALPDSPLAPFLLWSTHSVSLEGRDPESFVPHLPRARAVSGTL